MSSVSADKCDETSISRPGARFHASIRTETASGTCSFKASRSTWTWNEGWMMRRCRLQSDPSSVSSPSPDNRPRKRRQDHVCCLARKGKTLARAMACVDWSIAGG
eukprot:3603077-Rhodomonas_salina.2